MCLSKGMKVTDSNKKTLTYYTICPLSVHYESVLLNSTGPCLLARVILEYALKNYGFNMLGNWTDYVVG